MDEKDKKVLLGFGLLIICIIGSVVFLSQINWNKINIFNLSYGLAFVFMGIGSLVAIIKALTYKEKTPEELAIDMKKKMANVTSLETPCKVTITRSSSFMGAANAVQVSLNDLDVGLLKNGQTLDFTTDYAQNLLIFACKDANNSVFKFTFNAISGGSVKFVYNYMKGTLQQI